METTHADASAAITPHDGLYRRTDITPEVFFQILGRVRQEAKDEIERLIMWLDSTIDCDQDEAVDDRGCDGDTDAEPSLGSFDRMSNQIKAWQSLATSDDIEIDECDDEPSLGSNDSAIYSQKEWAAGNADDREAEHDGAEPDHDAGIDDERHDGGEDDEPSFGWSDEEAARGRYPSLMGYDHDREAGAEPVLTEDQRAQRIAKRSNVGPVIALWSVE